MRKRFVFVAVKGEVVDDGLSGRLRVLCEDEVRVNRWPVSSLWDTPSPSRTHLKTGKLVGKDREEETVLFCP